MAQLIRIKSGQYTFYSDGRNLFVKTNDGLGQQFIVQTKDFKAIDQYGFAFLLDQCYRRKIRDTDSFAKNIAKYRLVATSRKLV